MNKKILIVFSGYNQRAVIAFLRTLTQNHIQNYFILAAGENDSILETEYVSHVWAIRKTQELDYKEIEQLIDQMKKSIGFSDFYIPPSTEALNRFVLKEESRLNKLGYISTLVDTHLYEMISDKKKFSDFCENNGIDVPKEIAFPETFKQPFVAKPITYYDESGKAYSPVLIRNEEDYQKFKNNYPKESFYYQEYIQGRSIYLLYYFDNKKKKSIKFSQENLMQQANGKSILVAKPNDFYTKEIADKFEMLLNTLKYHGFIMIEIRWEKNNYYMIEANPRFWGPSQLFVDAGCNFFEYYLSEYGFIDGDVHENKYNMKACYYWHGGTAYQQSGKPVFYNNYEKNYCNDVLELLKWDVYRKKDTEKLFLNFN